MSIKIKLYKFFGIYILNGTAFLVLKEEEEILIISIL